VRKATTIFGERRPRHDQRLAIEHLFEYNWAVSEIPLVAAHRLLEQAVAELTAVCGPHAPDAELLSVLATCEGATRLLERVFVVALADLQRRGTFAERGYKSATTALTDLCGMAWADAQRRVSVAEQAVERVGIDASVLPAKLPATAKVYAAGDCSLRQVEVVAKVLASPPARRLAPPVWAAAEEQLAAKAGEYSPADLQVWGAALVETLDQDGVEPEKHGPAQVNELFLSRNPHGPEGGSRGGSTTPRCTTRSPPSSTPHPAPRTADDDRTSAQRQAEALAEVCGYVLDHASSDIVPDRGGQRPHLNVTVRLQDLENRARAACLDFGGTLAPEQLRMLCCDARVVPVVLGGKGQPLDVGRATRVIPDGLRRAIAARDRGCSRCGRPPSWCEIHHVIPWELGGETSLANCAMLCKSCHRLVHHGGWDVRIHDGIPEFLPPQWLDNRRKPRRRPPHLAPAS
jgi:5-methylcytosine-specific restriction protein A